MYRVENQRLSNELKFSTHLRCPSCTRPTAHPWHCGPGAGAHAQSVGREVVCAYCGLRCWWVLPAGAWLLKYTINDILHRKGRKVKVTLSLRTLR
ncbi:MAG: hypothetical protein HF975_10700 [ANME-2 cluster archaeon]|nr:hypothetical protein [ANME-2 cluster archaeon]